MSDYAPAALTNFRVNFWRDIRSSEAEKHITGLYISEVRSRATPDSSQQTELIARYKKYGDPETKNELVTLNQRLVIKVAKEYMGKGLGFLDLVQEGNFGLMHGIDKFEPDKGYTLSTYVTHWIKQSIQIALSKQANVIRIPRHIIANMYKVSSAMRNLGLTEINPENIGEVSRSTGLGIKTIRNLMLGMASCTYTEDLDRQLLIDSEDTLGDFCKDLTTVSAENIVLAKEEYKDKSETLDRMLGKLGQDNRKVLILRYGLDQFDYISRTFPEIDGMLGWGMQYSGIVHQSLRKLGVTTWGMRKFLGRLLFSSELIGTLPPIFPVDIV